MDELLNYPLLLFATGFGAMCFVSWTGLRLRDRAARAGRVRSEDFDLIAGATLSLLALIIGFTFSMAAARYDQRRNLEAAEANAIGTEFQRASLLAAPDAARVRALLKAWLDQRILFFSDESGGSGLAQINQRTDLLEGQLWASVQGPATAQPTAVTALVVAGMNTVLDARGFTQAALWNRIPREAWVLMVAIALCSNALLGYGSQDSKGWRRLSLVLPLCVSISFLLIADIDAPQHGLIRVKPENLRSLAVSLGS
jgi:hypothetical protein